MPDQSILEDSRDLKPAGVGWTASQCFFFLGKHCVIHDGPITGRWPPLRGAEGPEASERRDHRERHSPSISTFRS